MRSNLASTLSAPHLDRLQSHPAPLKAGLKNLQKGSQWVRDGAAMAVACYLARRTRKEVAALLDVGENQLGAWIAGAERPQTERFDAHAVLAAPMAVAKALQQPDVYEVRWVITAKVSA